MWKLSGGEDWRGGTQRPKTRAGHVTPARHTERDAFRHIAAPTLTAAEACGVALFEQSLATIRYALGSSIRVIGPLPTILPLETACPQR